MSNFTELLKNTREAKNLTKVDVAKLFGWSPMYYGRYENGYLIPTKNNIIKFADFLGISADELSKLLTTINEAGVKTNEKH